jgi:ketosteroid isomerase-like protein
MTSAIPEPYLAHLKAVTHGEIEALRELWEPDGVIEFPYAGSVGSAERLSGVDEIVGYFGRLPMSREFTFRDTQAWRIDAAHWVVETHGSSFLPSGKPYEQDYIVRFRTSPRGRLQWWREYWDPTRLG